MHGLIWSDAGIIRNNVIWNYRKVEIIINFRSDLYFLIKDALSRGKREFSSSDACFSQNREFLREVSFLSPRAIKFLLGVNKIKDPDSRENGSNFVPLVRKKKKKECRSVSTKTHHLARQENFASLKLEDGRNKSKQVSGRVLKNSLNSIPWTTIRASRLSSSHPPPSRGGNYKFKSISSRRSAHRPLVLEITAFLFCRRL